MVVKADYGTLSYTDGVTSTRCLVPLGASTYFDGGCLGTDIILVTALVVMKFLVVFAPI